MALRSSWPSANGLTTHAHARRDLEGAVVRNSAGKMRPGVFPAHHNPLFTRRNDMRLDIPDFRAVQDKGGPAWIAGEGATTTPAFGAAPAANKRIDLLYLTQELPGIDPTTEVGFFVEQGVASPSPSLPALPAARADAIPWLSVEIPAGATSMQSAGVIIKELYPYTAMAGGTVVVRDLIELAAWTPADGSRAFCLADTGEYVRSGSAWGKAGGALASGEFTAQSLIPIDGLEGYRGYELTLHVSSSSVANDVQVRLRAGGVAKAAASYHRQMLYGAAATAGSSGVASIASWPLFQANRNVKSASMKLFNLNAVGGTNAIVESYAHDSPANPQIALFGLYHAEAAACDGIEVYANSGTITGYYEVRAI